MSTPPSRRQFLALAALTGAGLVVPWPLRGGVGDDLDQARLARWAVRLRIEGLDAYASPMGRAVGRVGELARGAPYVAGTLEAYLRQPGARPEAEPLTLSLTRFDCVTLVESCLAVARLAWFGGAVTWAAFGLEVEQLRYRGGLRAGYCSRLHYFSEWIRDNAARGLLEDLGPSLGAEADTRPLRFMTTHRDSYPALVDQPTFDALGALERGLDGAPRWVVPSARIPAILDRIATGDVVAFATDRAGLDVTHAALAHRGADGVLRVLHAPLAGGAIAVTRTTLPQYVAAIRGATGILVARPLPG